MPHSACSAHGSGVTVLLWTRNDLLLPCMLLLATSAILTASSNHQTVDEWLWRAVDDSLRAADEIPVLRLRSGIELPSFDGGLRLV